MADSDMDYGDSSDREVDDCDDCVTMRRLARLATFSMAPTAGGGWALWTAALGRLVQRLGAGPSHCIVITQPTTLRYVQLIVGHGNAHLEASSNHYLRGRARLTQSHARTLRRLGFRPFRELPRSIDLPHNWWQDLPSVDSREVAAIAVATMVDVLGFVANRPVRLDHFGHDHPCPSCTWGGWFPVGDAA